MYPMNHALNPSTLKHHLQELIPGARVEITNRHKGNTTAECTINGDIYRITLTKVPGGYTTRIETPTVWTENEFDYESENTTHSRNWDKINAALKQLLTK